MDFRGIKISRYWEANIRGRIETLNQAELEKEPLLRKPVGSVIAIERIKRFNAIFSYSKNILAFLLLKN